MKTVVSLVGCLLFSITAYAQQASPVFVKATAEYEWENGASTHSGSVDLLTGETKNEFIISSPSGQEYRLPKTHAVKVSAEEAAVLLLKERAQRDADYNKLLAELESAQGATSKPSGTALEQRPGYTPSEATRRYYERKAARDDKARRDAALAIEAQKANALQQQAQELQGIRRELGK